MVSRLRRKSIVTTLLGLGLLCTSSQAFADDEYKTQDQEGGYSVDFKTDFLDGNDLDATAPLLRVRPPGGRMLLIRPRTSFVTELRKSVENL